jgi:sulfur-carrier protein adenylyltransferase/sulfurtransferase
MAISILIPKPLRRYADGASAVEVATATTIDTALAALVAKHPELRGQLLDDTGRIRSAFGVFLRDKNVRELATDGSAVPLQDGDTLTIVPATAGSTPDNTVGAGENLPDLTPEEILRYSRHVIMPEVTIEGQKRLKAARVLCIGTGGLGSPLTLYLAAAGVGTIGLVEFDTVDLTNIQRQILFATSDVGRPKIDAARHRLSALNPDIRIVPHSMRLSSDNVMAIFADYDVIADGSDNFPTRYLVNDACVLSGKPNVYGSIFRFEGQVSVFDATRGPCYRCLFPEPPPPGLVPSCAEGGVLGVLPGIIGSLQALEVLKLILGIGEPLIGRLVLFDALALRFRELTTCKDSNCPVCGAAPTIRTPIDYEEFCGIRGAEVDGDAGGYPSITVEEFHRRRQAGEQLDLLDVREPYEYEIVRIPGSKLVPLSRLPSLLRELDPVRTYFIHCHHSTRSVQAFWLLRGAGFGRLQVLAGGVDAWAERIDRSLPRY